MRPSARLRCGEQRRGMVMGEPDQHCSVGLPFVLTRTSRGANQYSVASLVVAIQIDRPVLMRPLRKGEKKKKKKSELNRSTESHNFILI